MQVLPVPAGQEDDIYRLLVEALGGLPRVKEDMSEPEADLIYYSIKKKPLPHRDIPAMALCHDLNARANGGEGRMMGWERSGMGPPNKPDQLRLVNWLSQFKMVMKTELVEADVAYLFSSLPSGMVPRTAAFLEVLTQKQGEL